MTQVTRRAVLAGSAATVLALPASGPAAAAAPASGHQAAGVYRFKIGRYELTALHDGTWYRPIDNTLVRNAAWADVQQALADNFLPADKLPIPFTALLVNTETKLVLIDTGTAGQLDPAAPGIGRSLAGAGVDPKAIDVVLISHFHPDHINGLKTKEGGLVFPSAEINVPAPEWTYWMDDTQLSAAPASARTAFLNARRIFKGIAKDVKRFEPGTEVAPGITSIAAYGHTPGHTAFAVASGNQSMLVLSDVTNHPWLFVRHPEWQAVFDVDGDMAAQTRKKMLDRAAADKMLVQGYHFPFPASGYITKRGTGYDLVPVMWQGKL